MRAASLAALGVAAYAAFLVATVPATFVAQRVSDPGRLEVSDAGGTLWNGQARVRASIPGNVFTVGKVRWHWRPARLLAGELAFAFDAQAPGLHASGEAARGLASLTLRDVHAEGDAAALASFVPLLGAWRPEGGVVLAIPALAWNGTTARGTASVEWRNAAVALSAVRPLGAYRVEARADAGPVEIVATTLDGPLRIAGRGQATPNAFQFSGEARADTQAAQALTPLLDLLGPKRPDGARAIEWRTPGAAR